MNTKSFFFLAKRYRAILVGLGYLVVFSLVLSPARHGLGLFWDWDWPIFRDHITTIFSHESHSWVDLNLGRPLLYQSAYYLRLALSQLQHLNLKPEVLLYSILVFITSATAYGVFVIARKKLSSQFAFILGLVVICNPAYLYKLIAGHFLYLVSFAVFIYFINFLFYHFKNNFRSALILGLFLAFVGFQIQFFIFAFIVLAVYYFFNCKKIKIRYPILAIALAILINLPWLSNFLIGANQVSNISGQAGNIAFEAASRASLLHIAVLAFSDATLIKFFYSKYVFAFFGLFSAGLFCLTLWRLKKPAVPREFWQVLVTLLIFLFLGTGIYQSWNIPIIKVLYPMLRESGHLAPVIVLFMILLLIRLWSEKKWLKWSILGYLAIFIAINAFTIYKSLPTVNYSSLRARLAPYKEFLDQDSSTYRIAAYPFFGQYSAAGEPSREVNGQPIRNTGIDVFTQSSPYDALSNYIPAQQLDQSVQFKFLQTLDLSLLESRNIKYLLDFSSIYQSNVEKYSGPADYHNDLSIIKNDPTLFPRLLAMYPDRIKQVKPNIYELTKTKPRVQAGDNQVDIQKINPSLYRVKILGFSENTTLNFATSYHQGWEINNLDLPGKTIATDHRQLENFGQSWYLPYAENRANTPASNLKADGSFDLGFNIYFKPETYFLVSKYVSLATLALCIIWLATISSGKKSRQ